MKENSKSGWEIRREKQKKPTKTGENDKTEERRWNMLEQKGKATQKKTTIKLEEINQKVLAKEGR